MTKEDEISKNLSLIEYYKEQLNTVDMQSQFLQAAIADYHKAKMTIEQLDKTEGINDILVPVGTGVFVNASTKDTSKVLIDIGAGVITEKTVDDAIKKIDDRIETLEENQKKLISMAQQLQNEAVELSNKTQRLMQETKQ
jgi:prefoldin alpha subunit